MTIASGKLMTPLVSRPHVRMAWGDAGSASVLVHTRLERLKGQNNLDEISQYEAAKRNNDMEAAFELVDRWCSPAIEDAVIDKIIACGISPIYVFPHPAFNDDDSIDSDAAARFSARNAIPFALAEKLHAQVGGEKETGIIQGARVGRSKLNRIPRFLYQPHFVGTVRTDRPYVLLDDTYTQGGTLAALRSYILEHGGSVAAVLALAHSTGHTQPFALTDNTARALYRIYGADLNSFWKEAIGHEYVCLTEGEGTFLVQWASQNCRDLRDPSARLQRLRDRLDRARSTCE